MGSDDEYKSRRRRYDDDEDRGRNDSHRRRRSIDRNPEKNKERRGSRDRRRERQRSRTPDSARKHTQSRERDRSRDRDRDRHRRRRSQDGKEVARRRRRDAESEDDKKEPLKRGGPLPSQENTFAVSNGEEPEKPKDKPNFGNSGILAAASNFITQADGTTVTLKYHEPPEARKPAARDQWKLFVFKGPDIVDTLGLSARSCWLVGREAAVVDLLAEHPSISKQHAVIQFRYTEKRNEFGDRIGRVKPYLIDLESANGTSLNGEAIPDSRYLELRDKDMVKFGHSTREYVIMLAPRE